jgi:SAM-dependent methyltransferase
MERWTEVDKAADPASFVRYLEAVSSFDATAAYKRRTIELLSPRDGDRMLEVGCGTGDEARAIARLVAPGGHVTAIDVSRTMIDDARARGADGVTFEVADAHSLAFPDETFDGCRVDRTLQHVADPGRVVAEMARVLKRGRRLVAAEPDWDTLLIAGGDLDVTRRLVAHKTDRDHRNGTIGRRLPALLADAGLVPALVETVAVAVADHAMAMGLGGLRESAASAARAKAITNAEAKAWLADLDDAGRRGIFFLAITVVTAVGERR